MQVGQCELCRKRAARYVCQGCGRQVCEVCLEHHMWVCSECYRRLKPEGSAIEALSWSMPLKLLFLGFFLTFVGIVLVMIGGGSGGLIWILPFPPIILDAGWPCPVWAIILAVTVTALGVVLFVLFRRQAREI